MSDIDVILSEYPELGSVRLCARNTIDLNVGPLTVNLAPEAFIQLAALLKDAMEQLIEIAGANEAGRSIEPLFEPQPKRCVH